MPYDQKDLKRKMKSLRARNNEGEFDRKDSLLVDARTHNRDSLDKSYDRSPDASKS